MSRLDLRIILHQGSNSKLKVSDSSIGYPEVGHSKVNNYLFQLWYHISMLLYNG